MPTGCDPVRNAAPRPMPMFGLAHGTMLSFAPIRTMQSTIPEHDCLCLSRPQLRSFIANTVTCLPCDALVLHRRQLDRAWRPFCRGGFVAKPCHQRHVCGFLDFPYRVQHWPSEAQRAVHDMHDPAGHSAAKCRFSMFVSCPPIAVIASPPRARRFSIKPALLITCTASSWQMLVLRASAQARGTSMAAMQSSSPLAGPWDERTLSVRIAPSPQVFAVAALHVAVTSQDPVHAR